MTSYWSVLELAPFDAVCQPSLRGRGLKNLILAKEQLFGKIVKLRIKI